MLSIRPRTPCRIVALLLICMTVGALIACQIHINPLDHGHAIPSQSHPSSAAHSFFDLSCMGMVVVLPTLVIFASFLFHLLHTTPLVLKHTVLAFLPFVPPRYTTC